MRRVGQAFASGAIAAFLIGAAGGAPLHAQRAAAHDAAAFWATLGDTTLANLVTSALDANRDVAAARARIDAARAARNHAAFDLGASIGAVAGYSRQRMSSSALPTAPGGVLPDQDLWDAGLRMEWEIDVFGRTRNSLRGRGALLAAAEDDARDTDVLIAAEVARTYMHLQGARERLDVARQNAVNQERTLGLTIDRLEAGRGTALDSERARAQLSSTRAEIPALEAAITALERQLAVLLARPAASHAQGGSTDIPLPGRLEPGSVEEIVRGRPDVRSAANRAAAEASFLGAARSEYLPRVSIGGVAGYTATSFNALGERGTPRYAVGPVISWPLLDFGRIRANVDAARAGQAAATAHYEQRALAAHAEIEVAGSSYARARERITHLEDAADASSRATDLARLRFEEGAADFLEVLDAERRQLEAQDRLASGRIAAAEWLVAVYRATGGAVAAAHD